MSLTDKTASETTRQIKKKTVSAVVPKYNRNVTPSPPQKLPAASSRYTLETGNCPPFSVHRQISGNSIPVMQLTGALTSRDIIVMRNVGKRV